MDAIWIGNGVFFFSRLFLQNYLVPICNYLTLLGRVSKKSSVEKLKILEKQFLGRIFELTGGGKAEK